MKAAVPSQRLLFLFKRLRWETWLLLSLVLFSLTYRLLHLPLISAGGDAVRKWEFVRSLVGGWSYEGQHWNHHTARWGVLLPALFTQLVTSHPAAYYFPSFAFAGIETALLFTIGRRIGGAATGFWASLLVILFPQMSAWSGQFTVEIFSPVYLLATLYSLIRMEAVDVPQQWRWLAVAVVCTFFAYLTKEPNVFFFPGLLYGLWLISKRRRAHLLAALGSLGTLFLIETLFYRLAGGFRLGRLSILSKTHLGSRKMAKGIESFGDFFERHENVSGWLPVLLWAFGITAVCLFIRFRHLPNSVRILLVSTCSFLFFHTFAVQSLSTLQPVQPPNERYFAVAVPFMVLAVCWINAANSRSPAALKDATRTPNNPRTVEPLESQRRNAEPALAELRAEEAARG